VIEGILRVPFGSDELSDQVISPEPRHSIPPITAGTEDSFPGSDSVSVDIGEISPPARPSLTVSCC